MVLFLYLLLKVSGMHKTLVFILALYGLSGFMLADTVLVKSDVRLVKLEQALPQGWTMAVYSDTLVIENPEPVWVLKSNFINVPAEALERDKANKQKIMEYGVETRASFVFSLKDLNLLQKAEFEKAHYFSKRYALFELSAVGFDTPYARYYPYAIEEQASQIYNVLLRENLKMGIGPVYPTVNYSRP